MMYDFVSICIIEDREAKFCTKVKVKNSLIRFYDIMLYVFVDIFIGATIGRDGSDNY